MWTHLVIPINNIIELKNLQRKFLAEFVVPYLENPLSNSVKHFCGSTVWWKIQQEFPYDENLRKVE